MLDTRTTERDIKGDWKDKNEQRNFFLLKKYGREVREQYDSALIKFDEDQKEYLAIEAKLEQTLLAAKKEKAGLLKSKQDYALKYEEVVWESAKMKQKLTAQQDKINIYKDKKEQVDVGQNLMKKENLMLLKEIEQREAQRQEGLQLLESKLSELKESQQKVALLRQANSDKRKEGKRCTLRTDEAEQQNMKMLNEIGILDEQIQANTSCIEAQLKKQGELARRYGDLKRHRKELVGSVKQLTVELSEEQRINQQLTDAEYNLNIKNNYIHEQIITNKQHIAELLSSNAHQRSQISSNKDCLLKLQRHLSILKQQNKQVERYMQQVLEQDYQIKSIIDRKHKTTTKPPTRHLFKDITQNTCESSLSSTMS